MNILWDFRLFSYGYAKRGIGNFTVATADSILNNLQDNKVIILGDKNKVPLHFHKYASGWIDYKRGNWKSDLLFIPLIILTHKIQVIHYWVALGPLRQIGLGLFNPCKSIVTIYDLGTEFWDVPFLKSVKQSTYWKVQKKLLSFIDHFICISHATRYDLEKIIPKANGHSSVLYMPIQKTSSSIARRKPYFITLGGSPHKNVSRTIAAFKNIYTQFPEYTLIIVGTVNKVEEDLINTPPNVIFEPSMERYLYHLQYSSGLLFLSLNEGLGIPPLEAMAEGCPILISDIPSLKETCTGSALFTDPMDTETISKGLIELIIHNSLWQSAAQDGIIKYQKISSRSGDALLDLYKNRTKLSP
jgi:glycosyltransferase involved in cell wall biosynthesis